MIECNGKRYSGKDEISCLVDEIKDGLGMPVDDGIKPLVVGFLCAEVLTTASCEGHTGHGLPYPWVDIPIKYEGRVIAFERRFNRYRPPEKRWSVKMSQCGEFFRIYPRNRGLPLAEMQQSAREFGEWLVTRPQRKFAKPNIKVAQEIPREAETDVGASIIADPFTVWCAGFFDGEGSVSIAAKPPRRGVGVSVQYFVVVTLTQNNERVLLDVKERFGGCVHGPYGPNPNRRQWIASRQQAHSFLLAVRPYLRVKAKQADVAIEFQNKKWAFGQQNQWTVAYGEEVWRGYKNEIEKLNCANNLNGQPKGRPKRQLADIRTRTPVALGETPCTH